MKTSAVNHFILAETNRIFPRLVNLRRRIHMYPELGSQERMTAALVARTLRRIGLRVTTGVGGTGVVGLLAGKRTRPVVAIRGDMDALPIQEKNAIPYRSRISGLMHACGHDAHTAMALGAAMVLAGMKDSLEGSVKFIFEPSEEQSPPGALKLIEAGVLKNPKVDVIFGQHVYARADAGMVGFHSGPMMAAADELYITIKGKGGHGALPHLTVDPVVIAAEVILALQKVVSRNANPFQPRVLTLGKLQGGTAPNVIPDSVHIAGTLRSLDERWRSKAHRLIRRTIRGITSASGAGYELQMIEGAPVLVNDPGITSFAESVGRGLLGKRRVFDAEPVMGGESFGYFLQEVPGTFFRLGIANKNKGFTHDLHTSSFDIDEDAMKTGTAVLAALAREYLRTT